MTHIKLSEDDLAQRLFAPLPIQSRHKPDGIWRDAMWLFALIAFLHLVVFVLLTH